MTHCERLLVALSDGEWHDHHSLYALNMIVHSRVADLRRKGHVIEHGRDGDLSLYRLVSRPLDEHRPTPSPAVLVERARSDGSATLSVAAADGGAKGALEQLTLEVAA